MTGKLSPKTIRKRRKGSLVSEGDMKRIGNMIP